MLNIKKLQVTLILLKCNEIMFLLFQHWAKRMGNKNINVKTSRGTNMSTVGVDIGDWIYEKKIRNSSSHGPVIFRTWDFGGQKE